MENVKKIGKISLLLMLVIIIIFFTYLFNSFDNSLPLKNGIITVPELEKAVDITFDAKGIPQIWAQNEQDAYFAMGYLHASDRLFQMDLTRRISQGKLSELLGSAVLKFDIQQRIVGHTRIAQKYLPQLTENSKNYLKSYAKGVNYYVNSCNALPFEYTLLGKKFKEWTVYDCLTILSFQTWFSNMLVSRDDFYVKLLEKLGAEAIKSFQVKYPNWAPLTVPKKEKEYSDKQKFINHLNKQLFSGDGIPFLMAHSSNSWVVSPQKSESGSAMLASDPHLEVQRLPQFWYYLGLHVKNENINGLGISTPGIPFIVMGHNGKAAYAFTVGGIDVTDYYQEKIDEKDSTQYLTADGWKKFIVHHEVINIAGQNSPEKLDVRETIHGPILLENDSLSTIYSLRWAGYEVDLANSAAAGFRLIRIEDYDSFRHTVTDFGALDANWTYADINGNIGYQLGTPIPVRQKSDEGTYPLHGWEADNGWQGFQALDKTPHSYNPGRGWLATCNNKQDEYNLDYDLKGVFAPDRIMRITQLLNSKEKFSVSDMKKFQMDTRDLFLIKWNDIIADLLADLAMPEKEKMIRNWNGDCDVNSKEAALVNQFLFELRKMTFGDELGVLYKKISRLWLYNIYTGADERWFDDINTINIIETKKLIAISALKKALYEVNSRSWGDMQKLTMRHPLSVVPILSSWLDLEFLPIRRGGTPGTLNSSFYFKDKDGFKSIVGPSWRFVIDFSDPNGATMVLPVGNSGNPRSAHYKDFLPLWKNGERWNVPIDREKVYQKSVSLLKLLPQN
jgi:penicillin amidase